MKLLIGLGNPGAEYALTRHNLGQRVVESYVDQQGLGPWQTWQGHQYVKSTNELCFLSHDYMNLSGQSAAAFANYYKVDPERLVVIHDDLDLAFGRAQFRLGGSSGGHRGVDSLIRYLGTDRFWRLRLGIGRPADPLANVADYVLERFAAHEESHLESYVDKSVKFLVGLNEQTFEPRSEMMIEL